MPKRISKVSFTSNSVETPADNEQYFIEDIEQLKIQGADDLVQLNVSYKDQSPVKGIIGICRGSLMSNSDEWIALPCPPYCHPNAEGVQREKGELSFQEALEKIKT